MHARDRTTCDWINVVEKTGRVRIDESAGDEVADDLVRRY
ncbi:hypothetical protein AERO9AM_10334 [Aeromicrobium sp. 9AM]|nr:hypothetical protein AERO9AM_10334 [Aeromicrobium sp. 9AM]